MNWIAYGLICVVVGVVKMLREKSIREAPHAHRCWQCGTTWTHANVDLDDDDAAIAAHTCPRCGVQQWKIETGGEVQRPAGAHTPVQGGATPPPATPSETRRAVAATAPGCRVATGGKGAPGGEPKGS